MLAVVLLMSISCRVMPDDYDWPVVPDHAEHAQNGGGKALVMPERGAVVPSPTSFATPMRPWWLRNHA